MTYEVEITPAAKRQIKKLTKSIQQLIVERLEELVDNPRPPGIVKMEGEENLYRVRVGDYRIIYEIQDSVLLIVVVKVGHRGNVYR
ncbi:MAG TPA: type II toxin-antitoxin system RelE/ParE family toxin [Leptolyngbyaceae cyanobacterium]